MDKVWWSRYLDEAQRDFRGRRVTQAVGVAGVERIRFDSQRNSGAGAIALAAHWGARRIILLGYDCQHTGGQAHWHADHPKGLGNAGSVGKWPAQFRDLAVKLSRLEIINVSRETALTCWPRAHLKDVL